MATSRGVFELKFFFTSSIASSDGGASHSAEAVRHKIKVLIDNERQGDDVLSDDRIVDILKETGIDIARAHRGQIPRGLAHSLLRGSQTDAEAGVLSPKGAAGAAGFVTELPSVGGVSIPGRASSRAPLTLIVRWMRNALGTTDPNPPQRTHPWRRR